VLAVWWLKMARGGEWCGGSDRSGGVGGVVVGGVNAAAAAWCCDSGSDDHCGGGGCHSGRWCMLVDRIDRAMRRHFGVRRKNSRRNGGSGLAATVERVTAAVDVTVGVVFSGGSGVGGVVVEDGAWGKVVWGIG
nr:hypothetical protein [Tanacetum cinerariifolium]